jgi:hypothetical protein
LGAFWSEQSFLRKISLLPATLKTTPASCPPSEIDIGSVEDMGVELYGYFPPHVGDILSAFLSISSTTKGEVITTIMPPVLVVMPELQEPCASPALPFSVDHVKVDLPITLSSPTHSDVASDPVSPSPALNPDALFTTELCDLLNSLEAAIHGCGRAIDCLLMVTSIKGKARRWVIALGSASERSHSSAKTK